LDGDRDILDVLPQLIDTSQNEGMALALTSTAIAT
jgi:hypothetical protein